MTRRPLTHSEALDSWRVHGELVGGHRPSETIGFVSALEDLADACSSRDWTPPVGVIPADCEPRWLTKARGWFGR
jgi:hypothetical protein